MSGVSENCKMINDVCVKTFRRMVEHVGTDLEVEAGSTGLRGYVPREKSARAFFSLICRRGDFCFVPLLDQEDCVIGFRIACCNDGGLLSLAEALDVACGEILAPCADGDLKEGS